ncbi:MAG: hypothetical protein IIC90_06680 [Chloroflexi bacterium]|nr:hypothetical protein [Chloroflexota bacterium]
MAQPVQIPLSGTGELSSAEAFWRHDPPYHLFILSSLAFAVVVGFTLAILAPLSIVLEWGWGRHFLPLTQAHGQAQTLGFVGLFIIGMVYRLMPRFSGRPLSLPALAWASWPMLSMAVVLRLIAQPAGEGLWQRTLLVSSGCLGMLAASAFALVVMGTLLHRNSRAGATGYFFVLAAVFFVLQAGINLALVVLTAQRGDDVIRPIEAAGLLHVQLYGFIAMFIFGVASRAIPTISGLPRPEIQAKAMALVLAAAVLTFAIAALWIGSGTRSEALLRIEATAFAALGPIFLAGVWVVGIFRPAANRLARTSQHHIWLIRSAFAWLLVAGGLSAYYGVRASAGGEFIPAYAVDAVRHTVGIGVASTMIVGMAMLILPEFAIRRTRYPTERWPTLTILALLSAAAALRVGAAVATPQWLSTDRYWPMAIGGMLAEGALLLFAALFVISLLQKNATVASISLRAARAQGPRRA